MKDILNRLIAHDTLTGAEAKVVLTHMAEGKYNRSQMASFLTVFLMRPITLNELSGFRDAMLELCHKVTLDDFETLDLCGTGGDNQDTFNISTLASFVVAGAGLKVVKHGNYGVSSVCGSSNVLEYLGVQFTANSDQIKKSLSESNICFLHAPLFHPAMKNIAPVRKELGIKTFFNMLGPMVNPAMPKNQLIGVFNLELARLYGYLYQNTDKNFGVVYSLDGYDEISLTSPFKIITQENEVILTPHQLHLSTVKKEDLKGGTTIKESASLFLKILKNQGTEMQNAVVIANAGIAIAISEQVSFQKGIEKAKISLDSKAAYEHFKKFITLNSK